MKKNSRDRLPNLQIKDSVQMFKNIDLDEITSERGQ